LDAGAPAPSQNFLQLSSNFPDERMLSPRWRETMDEQCTLLTLGWTVGGLVALMFILNGIALAAV
jgi:hypothetical protein